MPCSSAADKCSGQACIPEFRRSALASLEPSQRGSWQLVPWKSLGWIWFSFCPTCFLSRYSAIAKSNTKLRMLKCWKVGGENHKLWDSWQKPTFMPRVVDTRSAMALVWLLWKWMAINKSISPKPPVPLALQKFYSSSFRQKRTHHVSVFVEAERPNKSDSLFVLTCFLHQCSYPFNCLLLLFGISEKKRIKFAIHHNTNISRIFL